MDSPKQCQLQSAVILCITRDNSLVFVCVSSPFWQKHPPGCHRVRDHSNCGVHAHQRLLLHSLGNPRRSGLSCCGCELCATSLQKLDLCHPYPCLAVLLWNHEWRNLHIFKDPVCGFQGRTVASSLLHDPHPKAYTTSCSHVNVPFGYYHGVYWRYLPSIELLQLFPMALHRISHPWSHCPSLPSPRAAEPVQGSPVHSHFFYHHLPLHSGNVFLLRPCEH